MTPLDLSRSKNHQEITSLLENELKRAVKIHHSCYEGNLDMVKHLINKGFSVHSRYLYETFNSFKMTLGSTPLHFAVLGNNISIVEFLIKQKADTNKQNDFVSSVFFLMTPLHHASFYGFSYIVEYLVENNADLNSKNGDSFHFYV